MAEKTDLTRDEQRQIVRNAFNELEREFFRQFGAKMVEFDDGEHHFGKAEDLELGQSSSELKPVIKKGRR